MLEKKPQTKLKFDNKMKVSYPNSMYENVRKWSYRKGISMQDFQRKAVEFYIQHLDMDNMDFQNIKK